MMDSQYRGVAVVGSMNMDFVVTTDGLVKPGETILAQAYQETPGGKGLNQAIAAAKRGRSVLIAATGNDEVGRDLRDYAHARAVDIALLIDVDGPSGRAFINVDEEGSNSIVVAALANAELTAEQVTAALEIAQPAVALAQLETPLESVQAAATWCANTGSRFVLNPSPVQELPATLLKQCDPIIVNEHEAQAILGAGTAAGAMSFAEQAVALGERCGSVVLTAGAEGAYVSVDGEATYIPAPATDAVDTTGAGDEFAGSLSALLSQGASLVQAATEAVASASALVAVRREDR